MAVKRFEMNKFNDEARIAIWVFGAICIVMTFVFLVRFFYDLEVWFIFPRLIMYLIFYVPLTIVIAVSSSKIIKYCIIGFLIFLKNKTNSIYHKSNYESAKNHLQSTNLPSFLYRRNRN